MEPARARSRVIWHVALLVAASAAWEALFLHRGINRTDEGWPLYAAMRLHAGGTLYDDVFFVFPPGHLLAAWIGYALEPPGIVPTRAIYGAFNVALVVALYALGRRFLSAGGALLAAGLVAVAAPYSHLAHFHFGYRYLVWSALALLAFAQRLDTGDRRWIAVAGALTGVACAFRLTPAFAAGAAIGVGLLLANADARGRMRDAGAFALGVAATLGPVVLWLGACVGFDALWREVVVRPVAMTDLQSKPLPPLALPPEWTRAAISRSFMAFCFRAFALLYAGYAVALAARALRARQRGDPFQLALLASVVTWGGLYFARTLGRSDIGHLESALPPVCLVLAHLGGVVARRLALPAPARVTAGVAAFGAWVFLFGSDRALAPAFRGTTPFEAVGGAIRVVGGPWSRDLDDAATALRARTRPGDLVLDLTSSPILHVLSERLGPGLADLVMPGTFLDADEERAFVARLREAPPAVVVWPGDAFDGREGRSVAASAPAVARWVQAHYRLAGPPGPYTLMVPDARRPPGAPAEPSLRAPGR